MPRRAVILFAVLLLTLAAGLGGYAWISPRLDRQQGSGVALVGGPFTMTDQNGRRVTEKDFLGKHMLVFFGYTYCPDICPTELQVMMAALDQLGPDAEKVQPVFVSIDPARDTPEVMKAYVENFGSRLIGLTGSPDEVAAMAKAYRAYYAKSGDTSSPDAYLMDHSSIIYLMGTDGRFVKHFAYTTDTGRLAGELREQLEASP